MAEPSPEDFNLMGGLRTDPRYAMIAPQGMLSQILSGRILGESPADEALNRAGSVMGSAKSQPREAAQRQGPALATLSAMIAGANPIDWMGGAGGAAAVGMPMARGVGSKVFKSGAQELAQMAKPGVRPLTENHKLWPALIDETTGKVIHSMQPGAGQHEPLYNAARAIPGFKPMRGFVDPATFNAFTDKMLEAATRF